MKFGEQQLVLQVPEWSRMYVNYNTGKELVDRLKALMDFPLMQKYGIFVDVVDVRRFAFEPTSIRGTFPNEEGKLSRYHHVIDTQGEPETSPVIRSQSFHEVNEDDARDPFVSGALYSQIQNTIVVPEPQSVVVPSEVLKEVATTMSQVNRELALWFNDELLKVNRFYLSQSQFFAGRVAQVLDKAKKAFAMGRSDRESLKKSMEEAYYALDLLLSFCSVNYVSLCKVAKKFEKNTRQVLLEGLVKELTYVEFYMDTSGSNPIQRLKEELKDAYTEIFSEGDRKKTYKALHVKKTDEKKIDTMASMFHTGILIGANGVLFTLLALIYFEKYEFLINNVELVVVSRATYLFSVSILVIIMFLGFGVAVFTWERYFINFSFILELDPRRHFNGFSLIRMALSFSLLWAACVYGYVHSAIESHIQFSSNVLGYDVYPYTYLVLTIVALVGSILLVPDQWRWLLKHSLRSLQAPFVPVRFSDFFLADHYTSITMVLSEIQLCMCIWDNPAPSLQTFCAGQRTWKVPVLVLIPHFWRLLQCLRRYKDQSGDNYHPNLTNATKYTIGILNIFLAFLLVVVTNEYGKYTTEFRVMEIVWYTVALTDSTSKTLWDLYMDWGLLSRLRSRSTRDPLLRDQLWYPRWSYFLVSIFNIVARFLWVIRYFAVRRGAMAGSWGYIFFGAVEIIRRNVWSVIRLESEQLNNFESYRAVTITPPPFGNSPVSLVFEESDAEISKRLGQEFTLADLGDTPKSLTNSFDNVSDRYKTKITTFFATLPEEEKAKALLYLFPGETFLAQQGRGKSARFARLHEEDKVIALLHLFGRLTMEEYCEKNALTSHALKTIKN